MVFSAKPAGAPHNSQQEVATKLLQRCSMCVLVTFMQLWFSTASLPLFTFLSTARGTMSCLLVTVFMCILF